MITLEEATNSAKKYLKDANYPLVFMVPIRSEPVPDGGFRIVFDRGLRPGTVAVVVDSSGIVQSIEASDS